MAEAAARALDDWLHISPHDDPWHAPNHRYAVNQRGQRVLTFRLLADAKAWVAENYGPVKWEKRGTNYWPTPQEERRG